MNKVKFSLLAEQMPLAWHSSILGQVAGANIKVPRMDGAAYASEVHAFDKALWVISVFISFGAALLALRRPAV